LVGFIVLIALTIGIILHELHGITWAKYTKDGFKSIRFGVLWKFLTPYCHCKEPLVKHYIIGGIMPAIVLGLFLLYYPLSLAMYFVNFGIFFTMALW
jgi:hypothetical protein